jgi:hypothetical protein
VSNNEEDEAGAERYDAISFVKSINGVGAEGGNISVCNIWSRMFLNSESFSIQ